MLTNSEREWAIKKSKWIKRNICYLPDYPTKDELFDAARFSERMATKMAKVIARLVKEEPWSDVEVQATTPDLVLKWARLSVEKEMDNDT